MDYKWITSDRKTIAIQIDASGNIIVRTPKRVPQSYVEQLLEQKTRWGSCSSKGNLNFNWKLVRMPEEVLDYVVVHELAHRKEMNHSKAFWAIVESVLSDYRERRKWLKENGR